MELPSSLLPHATTEEKERAARTTTIEWRDMAGSLSKCRFEAAMGAPIGPAPGSCVLYFFAASFCAFSRALRRDA